MKKLLFIVSLLLAVPSVYSQCGYDNVMMGTAPAPVVTGSAVLVSGCINGGQFIRITNMYAGATYNFTTCGLAGYDTQISIYPAGGGGGLAYNDDACGLQSSVNFTPAITGDYDILIDQFYCNNSGGCAGLNVTLLTNPPCPAPSPVTATPNSFSCGGGTTQLNGTSAGNTIYWYTVPTGGTSFGNSPSGVDFPTVVPGTITYYAEAQGASCIAGPRTPVTVTVSDTTSPIITVCPPDTTVDNDPGMCTANPTLTPPSATDNCGGTVTITNDAPVGGFPSGITTLTWTADDGNGNTTTCTQTITVNDTEAPDMICPSDITQGVDPGTCTAIVTYPDPTVLDNCSANATDRYYLRSLFVYEPWGSNDNINAMDMVFGSGNWITEYFETANISTLFSADTRFVFLEGSDGNATELDAFLSANLPAIETWVNDGGVLLINSAPNEGGNINFGFGGTTLSYPGPFCNDVYASAPAHPIFNGPYLPVGTGWGGSSFSHSQIIGSGLTNLIEGCSAVELAYKDWGQGTVAFGAMTMPQFHWPAPDCYNLRYNILDWLDNQYTPMATGITVVQTQGLASGSSFPIGATLNKFVVTDGGGNQDSCSFTVTVVDDEAPIVLTYSSIDVDVNGSGVVTILPADVDSGSSDLCSPPITMVVEPNTFSCGDSCSSVYSLHFDGGDDFIEGDNPNLPQADAPRTIEAWINPELLAGQIGSIFEWGNTSWGERSGIMYNNQRLYYVGQSNDVQGLIYIPQNQWTHVAVTFDGSQIQLYVNGVADEVGYPTSMTNGTVFRIGTTSETPPFEEYFKGWIDEVRVWDYARTQSEIISTMNKCLNGAEPGLVSYFKLEEGTGTTATDYSLSAADGTFNNMTSSAWTSGNAGALAGGIPVVLTVTDNVGNSAAGVTYVNVNDPIAPTFGSCPADVDLCEGGAHTVLYTTPTATDNCASITVTQIAGLASGSLFTADTTINTFVAVDPSGNSDTCSFMVYIHPNPLVIWNLAPNNNVCLDAGTVNMTAIPTGGTYSGPGVTGATFDPLAAGLGDHYVNYTYTDGNGCATTVTEVYTVISCLGINGIDDVVATVYPNPSNGVFTIGLSNLPDGDNSLRLVNALGQIMYTAQLTSTNQTIDVSSVSAGTYYLQIFTEKGIVSRQIVITQQY